MSYLGDAFNFERFNLGDMWSKIKKNPERLLIGAIEPASTKLWNTVLGKDYEPLVDQMGGAYGGRVISMGNPDGGVYKRAHEAGINTGPGSNLQDAAHLIAAFYGAGGALGAGGGGGAGSAGGGLGTGGGSGLGGAGAAGTADAIPTVTVTGSTGGLGAPAYFAGGSAAGAGANSLANHSGSDVWDRAFSNTTDFSTGQPTGANPAAGIPGIAGPVGGGTGASSAAGLGTMDYAKLGLGAVGSLQQQQPQQPAAATVIPQQSVGLGQRIQQAFFPINPQVTQGLDPSFVQQQRDNAILRAGLGMMAAARQPGATFGSAVAAGLGQASNTFDGAMQTAYQNAREARAERRADDREERTLAAQAIPVAAQVAQHALTLPPEQRRAYTKQVAAVYKPAGLDISGALGPDTADDATYESQLQRIAQLAPPRNPISVAAGTTLIDPVTRQPVYTAPGKVDWQDAGGQKIPVDSVTGQVRNDVQPLTKTPAPVPAMPENLLSPQGIELAAQAYYETGKLPSGLGRGAAAINARVISRAAQIAAENGDDAKAAVLNRYTFQANQRSQAEALKKFTSGKQGDTVRSLNVAVQHLDQLQQLGNALNNNDTPLLNKIGNAWTKQTGGAAPVTFDAMKKVVTDELVKAIVGAGGGVADREEMAASVNAAQSPAQLNDVIANYKGLMAGQLNGLRQQYREGTGRDDFERFLLPTTRGELETHDTAHAQPAVPAPDAALEYLRQHRTTIGQFEQHYGYRPQGY